MNPLPPFAGPHRIARSAFTLIELLTVMVIISVLVALLFPILRNVRKRAESTQCISQLRQIGNAIGSYINDHEGYLPGPLAIKQGATYDPHTKGSLALLLEKYLSPGSPPAADGKASTGRFSPLLLCPAGARVLRSQTAPTYIVNMLEIPSYQQPPWGDVEKEQSPLQQSALPNWTDAVLGPNQPLNLATLWAVKDGDQDYFSDTNFFTGDRSGLPQHPAHGDHRHALFYDFHVARVNYIIVTTTDTTADGTTPTAATPAPDP